MNTTRVETTDTLETAIAIPASAGLKARLSTDVFGDCTVGDPVTGTEHTVDEAVSCTAHEESLYYFESEGPRATFREDPEAYLG